HRTCDDLGRISPQLIFILGNRTTALNVRLAVQWDVELAGELRRVKRTAREVAIADLESGNPAAAVVYPDHQVFGVRILFDIHFTHFHTTIFQEVLGAPAVRAPVRGVHDDRFIHGC